MLIRLFPESSETPTILFSLVPPSSTKNVPLPPYYNSQLDTLGNYGLPPPRSVYALDKAAWALALLEEVIFDLSIGKVGVKWVDGGVDEWVMPFERDEDRDVRGRRNELRSMLGDVVRGVKESEQRREDEKRENLVVNLLQSIPVPTSQLPLSALANISRPSSRTLRRQARSTLLDAFRLHVVHHLSVHHPNHLPQPHSRHQENQHLKHRASYPLWIARRCLESLMAEIHAAANYGHGTGDECDDDDESLATEETFEDSVDMEMDTTPNTSVTSIVPCGEDLESPISSISPSSSSPSSPSETVFEPVQARQEQGFVPDNEDSTHTYSNENENENENEIDSDKENSNNFANNNPYPSLVTHSRRRLPLAKVDTDTDTVIGSPPPSVPSLPAFQFTSSPSVSHNQSPPLSPPEPLTNPSLPPPPLSIPMLPNSHPTFIHPVHQLHALISHLEYEEDRQRAYLDPETNPDFVGKRPSAFSSNKNSVMSWRVRKPSLLRYGYTAEDLCKMGWFNDDDAEEEAEEVEEGDEGIVNEASGGSESSPQPVSEQMTVQKSPSIGIGMGLGLAFGNSFDVEQISSLELPSDPIFEYDSEDSEDSDRADVTDNDTIIATVTNADAEAGSSPEDEDTCIEEMDTETETSEIEELFLPTPPTSSDEEYAHRGHQGFRQAKPSARSSLNERGLASGSCRKGKNTERKLFSVRRKPLPSAIEPPEKKRAFLGTVPLPGDEDISTLPTSSSEGSSVSSEDIMESVTPTFKDNIAVQEFESPGSVELFRLLPYANADSLDPFGHDIASLEELPTSEIKRDTFTTPHTPVLPCTEIEALEVMLGIAIMDPVELVDDLFSPSLRVSELDVQDFPSPTHSLIDIDIGPSLPSPSLEHSTPFSPQLDKNETNEEKHEHSHELFDDLDDSHDHERAHGIEDDIVGDETFDAFGFGQKEDGLAVLGLQDCDCEGRNLIDLDGDIGMSNRQSEVEVSNSDEISSVTPNFEADIVDASRSGEVFNGIVLDSSIPSSSKPKIDVSEVGIVIDQSSVQEGHTDIDSNASAYDSAKGEIAVIDIYDERYSEQDSEALERHSEAGPSSIDKGIVDIKVEPLELPQDSSIVISGLSEDVQKQVYDHPDREELENGIRPPSPPPYISSRSQYDFEWGKHSPLVRHIMKQRLKNSVESNYDETETY